MRVIFSKNIPKAQFRLKYKRLVTFKIHLDPNNKIIQVEYDPENSYQAQVKEITENLLLKCAEEIITNSHKLLDDNVVIRRGIMDKKAVYTRDQLKKILVPYFPKDDVIFYRFLDLRVLSVLNRPDWDKEEEEQDVTSTIKNTPTQ